MELAKSFDPRAIEAHWYPFWESRGCFKASFDSSSTSPVTSTVTSWLVTPAANVSVPLVAA